MENLLQMVKTGITDAKETDKFVESKTENIIEGSSDQLLSVGVKTLMKLKANIVPYCQKN